MKKAIIFGAGKLGRSVFAPLVVEYGMNIIAYVDNSEEIYNKQLYGIPIMNCKEIKKISYDLIFIAVYDFDEIKKIVLQLVRIGVPEEKIVVLSTELSFLNVFMNQRFQWIKNYAEYFYSLEGGGKSSVAECGVFRGDSAKFLNVFFPDKKLYLFDTYEGFDQFDIDYEFGLGNESYNKGKFTHKELFANTDINLVMKKMKYPSNVEIRKGYFPETAKDIKDHFCFVNLDMDLYLPMLNGIRFFWDKVVKNGCILLHDYFRSDLPGVKAAVDMFEKERGFIIPKTPIGDGCSIALLK